MDKYIKRWEFAAEAHEGNGGFETGDYIEQYKREVDEKYQSRKKSAVYVNLFAQKIARYIGYLYRRPPARSTKSDLIRLIFDDADKMGNSADVFFSGFAAEAKVRGAGLLLVDMPADVPATLASQKEQRAVPYFVAIRPEAITDYRLDRFGNFVYIRYSDTIDESTPGEKETRGVIRHYDTEGWKVIDGEDVIESGEHGLGVCPVISFSEKGIFPSIGEFTQVAGLAKRHYNLKSELDEILRSQTFSLLTMQGEPPAKDEMKLSTDNAIFYPPEMDRPDFIAPPAAPATVYQSEIESVESSINQVTYDIDTTKSAESGIALQIKFQGLNGSLSNFAMRLEDLESRAFDIACKYLGIDNDVMISYPREFHVLDVPKEIETLDAIKQMGYQLPTYEAQKLKRIVQNDLGGVDDETMERITAEIDDALKATE